MTKLSPGQLSALTALHHAGGRLSTPAVQALGRTSTPRFTMTSVRGLMRKGLAIYWVFYGDYELTERGRRFPGCRRLTFCPPFPLMVNSRFGTCRSGTGCR